MDMFNNTAQFSTVSMDVIFDFTCEILILEASAQGDTFVVVVDDIFRC